MKKLLYTAILLQLSFSSLLLADPGDPNVSFNDSNLETAVALALGVTVPVTEGEMENLLSLSATGLGISDLTGLQYAFDVNELRLNDNLLSDPNDLLPISGLEKLIYLNLNDNQITGLPEFFLVNATEVMNELHLSGNQLIDLSPISGLTSLVKLYLDNNQITDISAVSSLGNLDTLFLSVNLIDDLTPVSGLTGLTNLHLLGNQIIDISDLAGLSNLTILNLADNLVVNISDLSNLTSLEELRLTNNDVVDISPVSNLTSLLTLYLADNEIVVIPDMSNLSNLQQLYLTDNDIIDIFGLTGEEPNDLTDLLLSGNPLNQLSYCVYLDVIAENNPFLSLGNIEVDPYPFPEPCLGHDICSDAIEVEKSVLPELDNTYSATTAGATGPEEESVCGVDDWKDVWHYYTPLSDEVVEISLCGSSLDTSLVVFDACPDDDGTVLACNDDFCGSPHGYQSLVTVELTGGQTYWIRVAGYSAPTNGTGPYELTITDANELLVPVNNTCADANEVLAYSPPIIGSTAFAYGTDITSCTASDTRDVWYYFIPTISGLYLIDPDPNSTGTNEYESTLAVFDGCGGAELSCNDRYCDYMPRDPNRCIGDANKSRIIVSLAEGQRYYIRIAGYAGKVGNYKLTVSLAADIYRDDDIDGLVDINDFFLLVGEWLQEGTSYVDIGPEEVGPEEEAGGGDKLINLWDAAALYKQFGTDPPL